MVDWLRKRTEKQPESEENESKSIIFSTFFPRWISIAVITLVFFSLAISLVYRLIPVPLTPLMTYRMGQSLAHARLVGFHKNWKPLDEISPHLVYAVIAAEDMRFFDHHGFDWEAIAKAHEYNASTAHRLKRGASTISQQVAKNVFLFPHRSWIRKGFEAYFTVLIELMWSKSRVMETYLNVVELGDGVYGAEAAAQSYFKKSARELNASEAALMAAVLPNPRRFQIPRPTAYVRMRQEKIRNRMGAAAATVPKTVYGVDTKSSKALRKSGSSRKRSIPVTR